MDPKGVKSRNTYDDKTIPGVPGGKGQTYLVVTLYNDGTEVTEVRRYSGKGPENDPVISTVTGNDPDQQKLWETQSKAAQTQQDQAERQVASRTLETNPQTGRPAWHVKYRDGGETWDEANVPAAMQDKPGQKTEPVTGPGGNTDMVTWELQPDGSKGRIVAQRPATKAEMDAINGPQPTSGRKRVPVEGRPGIYQVTAAKKDAQGNETTDVYYEDEQGNRVPTPTAQPTSGRQRTPVQGYPGIYQVTEAKKDAQGNSSQDTWYENEQGQRVPQPVKAEVQTINGKPYRPVKDAQGNVIRYEPITVASGGTQPPDLRLTDEQYGNIATGLRTKAAQLAQRVRDTAGSDNPYTIEDMRRDLETERNLAQAKIDEIGNISTEQRAIQNQQYGEAQSRRQWSDQAFKNASSLINNGGGRRIGATAGEDYVAGVKDLMDMQSRFAQAHGGFNTPAQTPLQKHILRIGPDGSITVETGAGGQSAPRAGGVPLANIGDTLKAGLMPPPPGAAPMSTDGGSMADMSQTAPPFQYDPGDLFAGLPDLQEHAMGTMESLGYGTPA